MTNGDRRNKWKFIITWFVVIKRNMWNKIGTKSVYFLYACITGVRWNKPRGRKMFTKLISGWEKTLVALELSLFTLLLRNISLCYRVDFILTLDILFFNVVILYYFLVMFQDAIFPCGVSGCNI